MRGRCDNGIVNACPLQNVTTDPAVNIVDTAHNKRAFPQCAVIPRQQPFLTFLDAECKALGKKSLVNHKHIFFSVKIGQADTGQVFGKIRYGKVFQR